MTNRGHKRVISLILCAASLHAVAITSLEAQTNRTGRAGAQDAKALTPSQPWPQRSSDVPADKRVRFGILSNGMRYAIMHNATPPEQASLMLRIDAGSLMEKDNQLGLAHFMEHMAFNGTTHIPKNDMISMLERLGLAFGADLNAATSFDETFYQLHMPKSDEETLEAGLLVLREQVSEATMASEDIVDERGVIAGEERLRNSPALRTAHKQIAAIAKGQKVVDRFPIGDLRIINTAERERFIDFYNSYYRPSRATIVAVGDFNVDAMEAKIRKQFGDWQPKGPEGPNPDLGTVATHHGEVSISVEPGTESTIALTWPTQPDLSPDTLAKRRQDIVKKLAFDVLNRRLAELSRTDNPPFIVAMAGKDTVVWSVDVATVSANFIPGKWKGALEAIDRQQRTFSQYGVTDEELAREIATERTKLTNAVKGAATRGTRQLAIGLIGAVNERKVVTDPETDLRLFEETVNGLTAKAVNTRMSSVFAGTPITLVSSPVPIEGGEAAIASAVSATRKLAVNAPVPSTKMPWPYTSFGEAAAVVSKTELTEFGATVVTFGNGTTLTFKHTDFDKDGVQIKVLTGLGNMAFSPDTFDPRQVLMGELRMGGLGKMNVDEISRSLTGHTYGVRLSTLGDHFLLSGESPLADLQLEMQFLAAYLTDPAFRSTNLEQLKAKYPAIYEMSLSLPGGAFQVYTNGLLASGDKREETITPELFSTVSMEPYREQLKSLLAKGPIQVTIVGDTTLEDAIRVTANTFGALPKRPDAGPPASRADQRNFPAPTGEPLKFTHKGLAEQGLGYVAWPTTDAVQDLKEGRQIEVLAAVLKLRVLEEIRERLGLAYAPGVGSSYSETYKGFGNLNVQAQTAPDKIPEFFKTVDEIVQKLRNEPVSEDELKRAREPLIASQLRAPKGNSFWLMQLAYLHDRPWYRPQVLRGVEDIKDMTPTDIQALARKYLRPELAWKAEVLPQEASLPTASASK